MTQRRRPDGEETVHFHGRISASLFMRLSVLALDPKTGKIPYGGWTKLLETMVAEFIERRSTPSQEKDKAA